MELGTRAWPGVLSALLIPGPAARLLQGQGIRDGCSRRTISFPHSAIREKCSRSSISFSTRESPAGLELAAASPRSAKTLLHTGNKVNHWRHSWCSSSSLTPQHQEPAAKTPWPWEAQPRAVCGICASKGRGFIYNPFAQPPCAPPLLSTGVKSA